jgi:hypothetical protein
MNFEQVEHELDVLYDDCLAMVCVLGRCMCSGHARSPCLLVCLSVCLSAIELFSEYCTLHVYRKLPHGLYCACYWATVSCPSFEAQIQIYLRMCKKR